MMPHVSIIRKELHQYPELSGKEFETAKKIKSYLEQLCPTGIIDQIGGTGIAAIYEYSSEGPTIMIRCELDALPIIEKNQCSHQSKYHGVSHKCGHDGHMAILLQLATQLRESDFSSGRVILLFQPAEETGKGAAAIIQDQKFAEILPDYVFALHNIPGESLHEIITMQSGFSAEVESFSLILQGKTSHAAEPQNGINPAFAISTLISKLDELIRSDLRSENFAVLTPVHVLVGEKSYGVSPNKGEIHYTIRTWSTDSMTELKSKICQIIDDVTQVQQLQYSINWFEYFPASRNDSDCNELVKKAADQNSFVLQERGYPFTFGEDFGWFSKTYKSAMFGIGAGKDCPALHHEEYDFPDEIIETGGNMFYEIIAQILNEN